MMTEYKLEKLAAQNSIEPMSSNETRFFSFDPEIGEYEWDIEVNADVVCRVGIFEVEIQYIKIKTENRVFYVGDGKYPCFESMINTQAVSLDWSF